MKRIIAGLLAVICLLLAGCGGWTDGSYVYTTPHHEQIKQNDTEEVTAANYQDLRNVLISLIEDGTEKAIVYVQNYNQEKLEPDLRSVIHTATTGNPIGAYAVEKIVYEMGSSGKPAVAVTITYRHGRSEIRRIKEYTAMTDVKDAVKAALDSCSASLVLRVSSYVQIDFSQLVEDYMLEHPESVMELPEVTVNAYPEFGYDRVLEMKFTYQTSRDDLRNMQNQVQPVFASAVLYVSGDGEDHGKLAQLYSFLMERFDYHYETSITPTYSLLRHGVGDCKAFAVVYAAMCREAGLECYVVSGTRAGEAWYWNIVKDGENYFHVDLLQSAQTGEFLELVDTEMEGYVWDYSAYPVCDQKPEEVTEPLTIEDGENSD